MSFSKMVDMRRSPQEKKEVMEGPAVADIPDYPYGLCISLGDEELAKLDLDCSDCESGDTIDLRAFAKVTSISKHDYNGQQTTRIELQIVQLAVENEDTEYEEEGGESGRRGRYK
jgi:hypothetical protein